MSDYPIWPQSLPDVLREGYRVSGKQSNRRIKMEAGPDRVVRVSAQNRRDAPCSIIVDARQAADFWSFYDDAANDGAAWVLLRLKTINEIAFHQCRIATFPDVSWVNNTHSKISFSIETFDKYAAR